MAPSSEKGPEYLERGEGEGVRAKARRVEVRDSGGEYRVVAILRPGPRQRLRLRGRG